MKAVVYRTARLECNNENTEGERADGHVGIDGVKGEACYVTCWSRNEAGRLSRGLSGHHITLLPRMSLLSPSFDTSGPFRPNK
jgi:hypothetical protein